MTPPVGSTKAGIGVAGYVGLRTLLHVVQCDDFDRAEAELASNAVDRRWQLEMARYVVQRRDGHGGAADRLSLIYNGDNGA